MSRDTFARFPKTSWTMIRAAKEVPLAQRRDMLEPLVQSYWRPLYSFFRAQGMTFVDAEDAVQSLLMRFSQDPKMLDLAPDRGRFRSWLIACAKNHITNLYREQTAKKRKPEQPLVSLDALKDNLEIRFEPSAHSSPEAAFVDGWRRNVVDRALRTVEQTFVRQGRQMDFEIFCAYDLSEKEERPTWEQLAQRYGLPTLQDAARRAYLVREELGAAIRDEIRQYAESEAEVNEEIRSMLH